MKPIYFPFTYIPESIAKPLSCFLGRIVVLQPVLNNQPEELGRLEENGHIEIQVPFAEDEERLSACSKEFHQWGQLHQGDEASLKDIFKNGFSRQAFTSQIRTDILKNGEADGNFKPDPVFLSRLFLLMAQELDLQQSAIDRELALSIDDELQLFTSMTGEEKTLDPPKESYLKKDYGMYMAESRISAWFDLMGKTGEDSVFLLTSSRSVLDIILEKVTGLEQVCLFDGISSKQPEKIKKDFDQFLMNLAKTPWTGPDQVQLPVFDDSADEKNDFKLFILPEAGFGDLSRIFIEGTIPLSPKTNNNRCLNTLIGFCGV